MSSKVAHLAKQGFISPPEWLPNNIMYETIMGSIAYGVSNEWSDADIYDVKFAYHVVRLISEVEQILSEGDLDLQRNREQLNSIRQGE